MLTAIRGDQIKNNQIHNGHVVDSSHSQFSGGIMHDKLNLTNSIVATFLHSNESVHQAVLESKLIALWDILLAQAVSGSTQDATTAINSTSLVDIANLDGLSKGVLTTGTGSLGAGTENYRIQLRDNSTKDPIHDENGGQVYAELTNSTPGTAGGTYILHFKKDNGDAFTMSTAEVSSITAIADVEVEDTATGQPTPTHTHSLNGKYFRLSSISTDYYVWYNVSGESSNDPAALNVGRTGIAVTIAPLASATDVATATSAAIGALGDFGTSSALEVVTVTAANAGVPLDVLADGRGGLETGFDLTVTTTGTPTTVDVMFAEIYSYQTAPSKAFINGVGFADIVGIAGSHNHHDLYYTKIEVETGQLDNRYYTNTSLDAGQLDNRYYTESELDPNPGSDAGSAKLDTRYYLESEIASSTGSSGASLVGYHPTGNLTSANVQNALTELQDDIDDIIDGTTSIDFSLDDAYDDGSVVAVDDTDVDWRLTDTKVFKVTSDTGATNIAAFTAEASGDVAQFDVARFTVNAAYNSVFTNVGANTTLTTTTSGNIVVNAADAVDIDGTNVTIDGSAASSFATTSANLTVETITSGTLAVRSAGDLTVKDQYIGTALPLSQTGVTGLSANFDTATSIVGGINENTDDLYYLINTTLPATTDSASGADQVGATGITGVIPTGGTLGADGTVQSMLEGIALGSAGGKVFPSIGTGTGGTETGNPTAPGNLLDEKANNMYFKANEIVYILDTNRYVIVKTGTANYAENTDWDYLWGSAEPMGGNEFNITSDAVTIDTTGALDIDVDGGVTITDDSGSQIAIAAGGAITANAGDEEVVISSTTEVEVNGGALVDVNATAVTIDGQLTATGAADDDMIITTTGTGEIQLSAADEIDLTGGDIDINAGTGKSVFVDSDTEVQINGGALVDIDAAVIDIDSTAGFAINDDSGSSIIGADSGSIDITGASDSNVSMISSGTGETSINSNKQTNVFSAGTAAASIFIRTLSGGIDVDAALGYTVDASGISLDSDAASNFSTSAGDLTLASTAANVVINAATSVDVNATGDVTIDGANIATTAATDGNVTITTTGTGAINLASEVEIDLNAPLIDIHGDVVIESDKQLYVDKINITSVDPADYATITGERGGTLNGDNLLTNSGFEAGSGADATDWTETSTYSSRTDTDQFYDAFSLRYLDPSAASAATEIIATQTIAGDLTDGNDYRLSLYARGVNQAAIQATIGGGTAVTLVAADANPLAWTRYDAVLTAGAGTEDLDIFVTNVGGEESDFFIDAVFLEGAESGETGETAASDYFTDYHSNLVFTIGDEDDDQIIFRSEGTATSDLIRINQDTVEILGDLLVSGDTTTVNTTELLVEDNEIILNHTVTGTPSLDAFYTVERGTSTDAQIKWNETTDKWELYNHSSSSFETIVTSSTGDVTVSMDAAYNGGSGVTVDDTNVAFTLSAAKTFGIIDGTDTSKFVVTAGSGADSVKVDTTGGVDIDAAAGVTINADSVITGATQIVGAMDLDGAIDHDGTSFNSNVSTTWDVVATGNVSIDTDGTVLIDSSSTAAGFGIDLKAANNSHFEVTEGNVTISTVTSGTVALQSAGAVDIDGDDITLDSTTGNSITATSDTLVALAGGAEVDLTATLIDVNGNFDQTGNYTFVVNTSATDADAIDIDSAGGMDITVASDLDIVGTNINTTAILTQTGATQIIGAMDFDGSIDADGETIDIAASGTGGTHLALSSADAASLTAVGVTIEAGTGAFVVEGDTASSINTTAANVTVSTTTSGTVVLDSAGDVTFDDSNQTNPIPFSQASADGFATEFAYDSQTDFDWSVRETGTTAISSIMAALNSNREDLWEYVELISTQGAAVGTAAGANLVGVDGIIGIVPMDESFTPTGTVGDAATLQEILNGLAVSGGGGKTYADEAAFTTAKAAGIYYKTNEHVRILDTNRTIIVLTQATTTVEGTDWDYLYGSARPIGDIEYVVNATSAIALTTADFDITTTTADITASGAVLIDGAATVTVDGATGLVLTTAATMDMDAVTFDIDGTTLTADLTGAISLDASAGSNFTVDAGALTLSTTTSGDIGITSAGNITNTATTQTSNVTTFDINASGAFSIDGGAGSYLRTTGADLNLATVTSGEITLKDARMTRPAALPLTDGANAALDFDPDGAAPLSLFDAINKAYNNTGDTSKKTYFEAPTVSSTDITNGYIQVSDELQSFTGLRSGGTGDEIMDLPGTTASMALTPSQLRNTYNIYLAVYLNGLRLSDSEWVYVYWTDDQSGPANGKKLISFNNDHDNSGGGGTAHSELGWVTVDAADAIMLSTQDHIVFDCTYQGTSNT